MLQATSFHFLGWALLVTAAAELLPLLTALGYGEAGMMLAFSISAMLTAFAGGALLFSTRDVKSRPTRHTLLVLPLVIWLVVPAFAGIPYLYRNLAPDFTDAYFEAVSGFTTTGATIFALPELLPKSIVIWRATTQWLGGFATLVVVIGLFPLIGVPGMAMFDSAIYYRDRTSLAVRLKVILSTVGWVYAILTFICFVCLAVARVPAFDAFCLALSAISTGGFVPTSVPISAYGSHAAELVLMVFMILGAANMTAVWSLVAGKPEPLFRCPELRLGGILVAVTVVVLWLGLLLGTPGMALPGGVWAAIFDTVSMLTTTGFMLHEPEGTGLFPAFIFLILVLVGGSFGSTAGGLKLMRVGILLRQAMAEVIKLAHPHGMVRARFAGRTVDREVILSIWAFFSLFVLGVVLVMALLTLFGVPFHDSWGVAVATFTNSGPLANVLGGREFLGYEQLSTPAKWTVAIGMTAGRLEIFPLAVIFSRILWQR